MITIVAIVLVMILVIALTDFFVFEKDTRDIVLDLASCILLFVGVFLLVLEKQYHS